jgi:cysteine-rich repeat protein
MSGRRSSRFCVVLLGLLLSCADDAGSSDPAASGGDASVEPEPTLAPLQKDAPCDEAPAGTPCGEPGQRMHCIFDACVRNACGDGFPADGESCDDGNERSGDGCSDRCVLEVAPGCGNGVLEPGEGCDDGNTSDADLCTADCTSARCGDGVVSAGEQCDDGNTSDGDSCTSRCQDAPPCEDCELPMDTGSGGMESGTSGTSGSGGTGSGTGGTSGSGGTGSGTGGTSGSGGTGSGTGGTGAGTGGSPGADCDACRGTSCTSYLGVPGYNVVAGCFDAGATGTQARTDFGAAFDASFVQNCVDAVNCAYVHDCAYDVANIVNPCYCGAISVDTCNVSGPVAGAPCRAQWEAATRGPTNTDVLLRISDTTYPSGWAYNVLECDATQCHDNPLGDCTP